MSPRTTSFRIRHILVAIRDVRNAPRSELRKAATIARAMHASLELFHAINEPVASDVLRRGEESRLSYAQVMDLVARQSQSRLERLAGSPVFRGLVVRARTSWDYPPHEAIVRRALVSKAGLVIAATRPHSRGARLVLTNTDWELIRQCPCPLLLTKSSRDYHKPVIVAAVDPFHAHAKPAHLDERILDAAVILARHLKGTLHAFHACMPVTLIAPAPAGQPLAIALPPELEQAHMQRITRTFDALAAKAGIPPARRHLQLGEVARELAGAAKRLRADLVVLGAVSRSGLRRVFIGSTAQRVLDRLDCDVLVIKPRGFVTRVPKRPLAALSPFD